MQGAGGPAAQAGAGGAACRPDAAARRLLWREAWRSVLLGGAAAATVLGACLVFLRVMPPLKARPRCRLCALARDQQLADPFRHQAWLDTVQESAGTQEAARS
jgi:hypothetical protein